MTSYLQGVGVSPAAPALGNMKLVDRRVRVSELILRSAICGLALVAALLVATDTQVQEIFTIQKKAKFTDMKSLVFFVVANGIAAAYSLIQIFRCVVSMVRGSVLFNKPLAWLIFSGDQHLASSAYMVEIKEARQVPGGEARSSLLLQAIVV
nr:CASP-like protein 2B1 [Tanacetum cinerariifolium]